MFLILEKYDNDDNNNNNDDNANNSNSDNNDNDNDNNNNNIDHHLKLDNLTNLTEKSYFIFFNTIFKNFVFST